VVTSRPLEYADEMTGSGSIGIPVPEVTCGWSATTRGRAGRRDREVVMCARACSAATSTARGHQQARPDGWLRTGDLCRQDERASCTSWAAKKTIIRRSGMNLTASEVEDALRAHPMILGRGR